MIQALFITDKTTGKQYICKKWEAETEKPSQIDLTIYEKELLEGFTVKPEIKIKNVGELIDYLECFDRNTKILDNLNPCWWSPRKPYNNEDCPDEDIIQESIIDAMCVATDLQLIDENNDSLDFAEHEHYNIHREEKGEYGDNEYVIRDNNLIGEKTIVYISTGNVKLDNILANAVWGKIKRFMENEPHVTLD